MPPGFNITSLEGGKHERYLGNDKYLTNVEGMIFNKRTLLTAADKMINREDGVRRENSSSRGVRRSTRCV